jgi:hypothetical protein
MISAIVFLGVAGGIVGALFCALNKSYTANLIWGVSNLLLILYNLQQGEQIQAGLFLVYEVIALFGVCKHCYEQRKIRSLNCS